MSKAVFITGAGGRIGAAIACKLAAHGFDIALHCRKTSDQALATQARIAETGGKCQLFEADLADADASLAALGAATQAFGGLIGLVNNASLFEKDQTHAALAVGLDRHWQINTRTPVLLAQEFARDVASAGGDRFILNVLDQRVLRPTPKFFSYTLSRMALWDATILMAQAFAPQIRVNAIGPGPSLPSPRQDPAAFEQQVQAVPLQRASHPDMIADGALYLATAQAVTGVFLPIDSGQHLAWRTPDVEGIDE